MKIHPKDDPMATPRGLKHFEQMSGWLDSKFTLPGTRFKFGFDGLIGLIPGVGDTVTAAMGIYAWKLAGRIGAPGHVKARIAGNIAMDWVFGSIPLVGDVFDFAFRAHRKNYRLLKAHAEKAARDV